MSGYRGKAIENWKRNMRSNVFNFNSVPTLAYGIYAYMSTLGVETQAIAFAKL